MLNNNNLWNSTLSFSYRYIALTHIFNFFISTLSVTIIQPECNFLLILDSSLWFHSFPTKAAVGWEGTVFAMLSFKVNFV